MSTELSTATLHPSNVPNTLSSQAISTTVNRSGNGHDALTRPRSQSDVTGSATASINEANAPKTRKVRLAPHIDSTRTLMFFPTEFEIEQGGRAVQIGRFSEKNTDFEEMGIDTANNESVSRSVMRRPVIVGRNKTCIAFQSKVVSRLHAELWCDADGHLYIRDTKSSSGTFVNRCRLSPPGQESRSYRLNEGDLVQFGIDYQGGSLDHYRAIKVRFEIQLESKPERHLSEYANSTLQKLQAGSAAADENGGKEQPQRGQSVTDCCICLMKIRVFQSLFISPCSHMFHYKCIRPMIQLHYPGFSCPLCRSFFDLEEDVQDDTDDEAHNERKLDLPRVTINDAEPPQLGAGESGRRLSSTADSNNANGIAV